MHNLAWQATSRQPSVKNNHACPVGEATQEWGTACDAEEAPESAEAQLIGLKLHITLGAPFSSEP